MRNALAVVAVGFVGWATACGSSSAGPSGSGTGDGDSAAPASVERDAGASGGDDSGHPADASAAADASARADGDGGHDAAAPPPLDAASDTGRGGDAADALPGWTLTWSDEFNGPDGSAVDSTKWAHDVGGDGWGNQEREYYTNGAQNAVVQGGSLVITATTAGAAQLTCWYGACQYTSARLLTQTTFSQQYGRFEARIQIPEGQGLWPAFWMLGSNIATMPWPACGEIDIMENIGKEPSINHGSLHAPGFPGAGLTGQTTLAGGAKLGDAFHTYAAEWTPTAIRFYLDDQLYETQAPGNVPAGGTWVFNNSPFFLLLNVAVGGQFPGDPDATSKFPQTMKVDWVRVYRAANGDP